MDKIGIFTFNLYNFPWPIQISLHWFKQVSVKAGGNTERESFLMNAGVFFVVFGQRYLRHLRYLRLLQIPNLNFVFRLKERKMEAK